MHSPPRSISYVSYLLLIITLLAPSYANPIHASAESTIEWQSLETKHSIIHYQSQDDLMQFRRQLKFGPGSGGFFTLFSSSDPKQGTSELVSKVDAVFERVQEILGMRKIMDPVIINLYKNRTQLNGAYREIYGTQCRIRAWYRFKNRTIYINVKDFHEGILAHEMAHFIIDNYLSVRPPRATAEILARYVDIHLKD
ncbi:MAG: hypothetical protein DRG71_03835 [Deltaproteobacteria bacterium]|nr:MAG: hypothetical protein DRG71_03835 [Deltaproteobacteria bacterium]HDG96705.1 hypothetical protein [Desulfobacterales bacterium]